MANGSCETTFYDYFVEWVYLTKYDRTRSRRVFAQYRREIQTEDDMLIDLRRIMTTYRIPVTYTGTWVFTVEAEDEDRAIDKLNDLIIEKDYPGMRIDYRDPEKVKEIIRFLKVGEPVEEEAEDG